MTHKKVGLALGSGAARGLAHIGVLEVLEREGIPIDMIAGTSIGALIGALYAQGKKSHHIKELALEMGWARLVSLVDLTLPKTGLIGGNRIKTWLRSVIGKDVQFSDLKMPFACVATDVMTGEEMVMNCGSVLDAVRATISIPSIFTLVNHEGRYLVDGTLVNPVPVSVLKNMGAEFIIAVNVIPDLSATNRSYWTGKKGSKELKELNIIDIVMQSIYIGVHTLVKAVTQNADVVIEPQLAYISPGDFLRARECIRQGEVATQDAIPELKRRLAMGTAAAPAKLQYS